jgi:hypothetical protein
MGPMSDPLRIRDTVYLGGFDHLGLTEPRWGTLVLADEAVTLTNVQNQKTRRFPEFELCRTRAIASLEVTSEQVAKSKVGAALLFGVLGGLAAKGAADRATIVLHLKSGVTGYIIVKKRFAASVLGLLAPWRQAAGIPLGDPRQAQTDNAQTSVADELAKLAQLRDSGVLTDGEFDALKAELIRNHTSGAAD